jgi:nitroimidazol reductase NimA-like FMN-containing flavoprotein (pyridoxamine 5'-phosphate oxidase superfamily)
MKEYQQSKLNRIKQGANIATYDVEKIINILDAGFITYVSYLFKSKAISIPMAHGRISNCRRKDTSKNGNTEAFFRLL